jgi:hypothetical protein
MRNYQIDWGNLGLRTSLEINVDVAFYLLSGQREWNEALNADFDLILIDFRR